MPYYRHSDPSRHKRSIDASLKAVCRQLARTSEITAKRGFQYDADYSVFVQEQFEYHINDCQK